MQTSCDGQARKTGPDDDYVLTAFGRRFAAERADARKQRYRR